ncbi:MAG TPA: hypothetical protein VIR34_13525, partial [Gemmatimonadaceae bacterium]
MTANNGATMWPRIGKAATLAAVAIFVSCRPSGSPAAERVARAARGAGDIVIGVAWPWAARREVRYGEGLDMAG